LVEITTFRSEQYNLGSRKPKVAFVKDMTADLSRRDFTINAIAKRDNRVIDPFNGRFDIQNKVIKCVGEPKHRFKEDPLRMLRAGRFASQLNFCVEYNTESAVFDMSYKILEVSKERWVMELDKLLDTPMPSIGLNFLMHSGLLKYIIPELALQYEFNQDSPYHDLTLWDHTVKVVDLCPSSDINLRWSALLHDIAKPFVKTKNVKGYSNYIRHDYLGYDMVKRIGAHFKWSNDRLKVVSELVRDHLADGNVLKQYDNLSKKI
jgi:tRNA nucleotidyltransferase (CCA-adding enzyme)